MMKHKRNEWLDADESDQDQAGYSDNEESRTQLLPGAKRRKVYHGSEDEEQDVGIDYSTKRSSPPLQEEHDEDDVPDISYLKASVSSGTGLYNSTTEQKQLLLQPTKPKKNRTGIIYLSRVPPFMKPSVLRSILSPYGEIGRIFCTPESSTQRTSRLKSGGTRRKLFLDGWVEFLKKRDAKTVASMLNAQTIGGKKRSKWHDEVWNIRYLKGVRWEHLVEQIQNENAERAARMRADIAQSTRENRKFLENIDRGKMVMGMEAKKKKRMSNEIEDGDGEDNVERKQKTITKGLRRTFAQNETKSNRHNEVEETGHRHKVLSSIF